MVLWRSMAESITLGFHSHSRVLSATAAWQADGGAGRVCVCVCVW
jgi:hypothetical protein